MRLVKPKKLKKGDTIGIISPASSPGDLTRIESGVKYFESMGYKVIVGKHVGKYYGYLAGSDEERVEDLHIMFSNKNVKAIVCVRGGYGTGRLLDKINYKIIRNNPKIFVGYSDITALQMAFMQKANLITFAGPMLAVDFYNEVSPFTEEMFWAILTSNKKFGRVKLPDDQKLMQLTKGMTKGRIVGGNLSLVSSLLGSAYMPQLKERILLLEETGEAPYRIDRMLNQLKLAKVFKQVNGVILGTFSDCVEHDPDARTLSLGEVIDYYLGGIKKPVVYNFKHGHIRHNITVPFGISVKMNASRNFVEFTEAAVT